MSRIVEEAEKVASGLQSLEIKANYTLMATLLGCLTSLKTIVDEANKLEAENAEFKKALGINDENKSEPEETDAQ